MIFHLGGVKTSKGLKLMLFTGGTTADWDLLGINLIVTQPTRHTWLRNIIENIWTNLLLGQTYPCCQSRCHTHTTLTTTPKSDTVCSIAMPLPLLIRPRLLVRLRKKSSWTRFLGLLFKYFFHFLATSE